MRRKLSNQFLSSYLVVLLLTILATALAFVLLSLASEWIEGGLAKNRYPADSIMRQNIAQIDSSGVVASGGGVQAIDKQYRIIYTQGLDTFGKSQLSVEEFTAFLLESHTKPYHYDVLYEPEGEFWLVVTFPVSFRIDFSIVHNPNGSAGDFRQVFRVLIPVGLVYLSILALATFLYSRATAAGITIPLRKLADGTRLLREGDYSARVDLHLNNEFAELQSTFNDMADRIEREMALRKQSEQDRRKLILDVSHDLKNPLSSIIGYSELCLKKTDLSPREQAQYLQIIHQNGIRANLLLNELFDLSRMESPAFTLKTETIELCEFVRRICGELTVTLDRAGFLYEFEIPEESVLAAVDLERFRRIIQNLADNAIRYNTAGTTISVQMTIGDVNATIRFADDGCGIPAHLSEEIFRPFVRADDSRNSETGGSGLGLSIAKRIARAHGGDLTLRSDTGEGCEFFLTIPTI